jgi:hypothetical protein
MASSGERRGARGDAEAADPLPAEREETAVADGLTHGGAAADTRVKSSILLAGNTDIFPAVQRLKEEQARLRAERKRVAKELKNAEKRRSRLKRKAKQLTDGDLLAVLETRALEKERAKLEVAAAAAAAASGTPTPGTPPS